MEIQPGVLYKCLLDDLDPYLGDLASLAGKNVYPVGLPLRARSALSLSNSILRKYVERTDEQAEQRALDKFLNANSKCGRWVYQPENVLDEMLLNEFKNSVWRFFNPGGFTLALDPQSVAPLGQVGSGANIGARGQDLYTKIFDSPLTCTDHLLYKWYSHMCKQDYRWSNAEMARESNYGSSRICEGSRLSFVPKTTDISRVICVEPTLNMWFQLGVYDILHKHLRSQFKIDFADQQVKNREMARSGSVGFGYTTIDLESASDTISKGMLEWALPKEVFRDLSKYRCSSVTLPSGGTVALEMFSSMGNGFTFPLQTIIFACAVCSVYRFNNIPVVKSTGRFHGNFGVFGDDIVCLDFVSRHLTRLLDLLGFTVNQSKSFSEGPFRESCGADFYHGLNLRGVYLKEASKPAIYSALNLLTEFSARTGVYVPRLCRYLRSRVPFTPIPLWENNDAGIKTHPDFFKPRLDRNGSFAYKAWRPVAVTLKVHKERTPFGSHDVVGRMVHQGPSLLTCIYELQFSESRTLQRVLQDPRDRRLHGTVRGNGISYLERLPSLLDKIPGVGEGDRVETRWKVAVPRGSRSRDFNPFGMHLCFLAGALTSMRISVRHDRVKYTKKLAVAPNWVYTHSNATISTSVKTEEDWRRWETAFFCNL